MNVSSDIVDLERARHQRATHCLRSSRELRREMDRLGDDLAAAVERLQDARAALARASERVRRSRDHVQRTRTITGAGPAQAPDRPLRLIK